GRAAARLSSWRGNCAVSGRACQLGPPVIDQGSERLDRTLLLLSALLLRRLLLRHHTLLSVYERGLRDTETSSSCTACASAGPRASVFRSARLAVRVGW